MSNGSKHTPGPWQAYEYGVNTFVIEGPDYIEGDTKAQQWIAQVYFSHPITGAAQSDYKATGEANARLIAAAPDMLELAQRMDAFLSQQYLPPLGPDAVTLQRDLKIAIAKAEGRAD